MRRCNGRGRGRLPEVMFAYLTTDDSPFVAAGGQRVAI